MYESLIARLTELRKRTARFRRVALHLHSPDSRDWARGSCDPARNHRSRFEGLNGLDEFANELKAQLDFACVTDHMRHDFATRLSERVGDSDGFMVLPGTEVNFRLEPPLGFARIHLLTILPEGATNECFARLFHSLAGIPNDARRTGQEEVTGLSLKEWVERVHDENGICIAAHVENNQGIRYRFRQVAKETLQLICGGDGIDIERANNVPDNLKEYLYESGLDAIEIHRPFDSEHYRWVSVVDGTIRAIATTLTFDAHTIEEFNKPDRVTHIKMTKLGLKGLKQALMFPDTRIRYPINLPTAPSSRLLGIQIHGEQSSFFEDITIALTENLNCLIGVRGSGKSTFVEALRYIFGYNLTLGELDKSLQENIRKLQRSNLTGTRIRVVYRTSSGEDRVLEATYDEKSDYTTKVFTINGDSLQIDNVEATGDYPLRLYGWSEIENLGREPARQRDLLDRLIPELLEVHQRRLAIRNELRANRGVVTKCIQAVKAAFDENNREITRFKEFTSDFNKLNTEEVKNIFSALDLANAKQRILLQLQENAAASRSMIGDFLPFSVQDKVEDILSESSQELRKWWSQDLVDQLKVLATEAETTALLSQSVERIRLFESVLSDSLRLVQEEIVTLQKNLRESFAEDDSIQRIADLRQNAERRLIRVTTLRNSYLRAWTELQEALKERQSIAQELNDIADQIAGIRVRHNARVEETLNKFLPADMMVSIAFQAGRDTIAFQNVLHDLYGARSNQRKKIKAIIEGSSNPVIFAKLLLEADQAEISKAFDTFETEDSALCVTETKPFDYNENAEVDVLLGDGSRLEKIIRLQETEWDDYEVILLNGSPVNEKSPGQRSSAMLPLIALAQETPLIIDQPEDNLDKRLIGTVLMKVLSTLKEKRQIIVCTHDPNILVGGDAEQVVVLEAESDRRGRVVNHGSIDNDDIVETVINLLEGGREAFEARRKRYRGLAGISN